ncbi:Site-specific DNA recombinase [Cohaesibacter marisflavi]|uniref:Site-specific DNA recombinase n=1 Tax=Cohaesibacter marisflavi TaxID=655353 RepID=A0A1I5JIF3_9HYPH|nr:recombinase family protein [Cohaesibacter marisflavi]SFO72555.1 Site-specific DNA recombinase [Cohaesibacter marisflavi]
MSLVGYARVSSVGQSLDVQEAKLQSAGCEEIFREKRSGVDTERPQLKECMRYIRKGDTLVISRIDRLARSAEHLLQLSRELEEKGVTLKVLDQSIDTGDAAGKAFLGMLAVFAQFENDIRKERQMDGIAKAREKGVKFGRRPVMTEEQEGEARQLRKDGWALQRIADHMGVSKGLIHKVTSRPGSSGV